MNPFPDQPIAPGAVVCAVGRNAVTRSLDRFFHNRFGWQPLPPFRRRPSSDVFRALLAANRQTIADGIRRAADPLADGLERAQLPGAERVTVMRRFNLCAFVSRLSSGDGESRQGVPQFSSRPS